MRVQQGVLNTVHILCISVLKKLFLFSKLASCWLMMVKDQMLLLMMIIVVVTVNINNPSLLAMDHG